jgi:hypothetical protein
MLLARRAFVCLASVAALALLAFPAGAAKDDVRAFKGRIKGVKASTVFFTVVRGDAESDFGPGLSVDDVRVSGAPCSVTGTGDTSVEDIGSAKLIRRRFSVYLDFTGGRGGSTYELDGRLRRSRARGTLDFHVEFDKVTICDTGPLRWRVHELR